MNNPHLPRRMRLFVSGVLFALAAMTGLPASVLAADGTWTGSSGYYSDPSKWSSSIASGTGATATFGAASNTITLDANQTIGNIALAMGNPSWGVTFTGSSASNVLTFSVASGTPLLAVNSYYSGNFHFGNMTVSGTQGLNVQTGYNTLVLKTGLSWIATGTVKALQPAGDGNHLFAQGNGVLPSSMDLDVTGGSAGTLLVLNGATTQSIGALIGTRSNDYIAGYSGSNGLHGGNSPAGTNTLASTWPVTLQIGSTNHSGTFQGTIGQSFSGDTSSASAAIHVVKTGIGTQVFSGPLTYSGSTTVSSGRLLVNGTHSGGAVYTVNSGATLGGKGKIAAIETTGTTAMVSIQSGGDVRPGSSGSGSLTLSGTGSASPVLVFATGATATFDLSPGLTYGNVVVVGGTSANDVGFNNTVFNFNDLASGGLAAGQYLLFQGDANTSYSGLTVDASGKITSGVSIGTGLSAYPTSYLQWSGNNIILNVVLPPPNTPTGLTVTGTAGGVSLTWNVTAGASSYALKRSLTAGGAYTTLATLSGTSYTDRDFIAGTTYYYVVSASNAYGASGNSTEVNGTPAIASGTWSGNSGNYSDAANWSGGVAASGVGANLLLGASTGTVTLDTNITIGSLGLSMSSPGWNVALNGASPSKVLTFAAGSGMPSLSTANYYSGNFSLGNLTIAGTQGLSIKTGYNTLLLKTGLSWSATGILTFDQTGGDANHIFAQGNDVLPGTMDLAVNGSNTGTLMVLNGATVQTIGALSGNGNFYIAAYSGANGLHGGNNPSGTNVLGTTTPATLQFGSTNQSGTFAGVIGQSFAGDTAAAAAALNVVKLGTGTEVLTGTLTYSGTTGVNGGWLILNGTHRGGGTCTVRNGAGLGGTGTIVPVDTTGTTYMINVLSGGVLRPGVGGTGALTLNGTSAASPILSFASGATALFDLNSSLVNGKAVIVGGAAATDVTFNNTVFNFNDLTSGALTSGTYVLMQGDANTSFGNITVDGSNTITSGVSAGAGLEAYTGYSLKLIGNSIVLVLNNPNEPVPVALSFNFKTSSQTGMSTGDVAGAPGARFASWNNFNMAPSGGTISNLVDSNGGAVTGVKATYTGGNVGQIYGSTNSGLSNDVRLFDTFLDQYDSTASTITVSGIPYAVYDVYFYMTEGAARGGAFTANGTTYYARAGVGNPTSSGSGYVLSTDTVFSSGSNTQANYVKFTALSGSLSASFVAMNQGDSVQRLKVPGFQIVGKASPVKVAPSAPAGVTITATGSNAVLIQWNASNTATQYQIFRSTTAGSYDFNNALGTVTAPGGSYTDTTAVAGTTYYYVVRAVNGIGAGASSTEISTPAPNLDSVAVSSPVIWPGGSTSFSWAIPNATNLTIDSGSGPQAFATSGTLPVTKYVTGTTSYTFTAVNPQGQTSKTLTVTVVPKPANRENLWQWSVQLTGTISGETNDYPRAFLYIPPGCQRVRGAIVGQHNMLEEPVLEHPAVRDGLAAAGMAAVWVSPAFNGGFDFVNDPNAPVIFQQMMDALALESGYAELSKTPVVWIGHSAMSEAPYAFGAWDTQHSAATGEPRRCAAAISLKGYFPGKSGTPYPNSDLIGVPIMYIDGEFADANGRATSTLSFRNGTPGTIVSFLADVGGGHFDWHDRVCEYIGMYLRKVGEYRLPVIAAPDGTATLQTINTSTQGWLADRWRWGQNPTANPAPVGSYTGNTSEAFWYFDQEHAEATNNYYLPVKSNYQLLAYTQNGTIVNQNENHEQVDLAWSPDPAGDGLTFKLGTAFLDVVPDVSSRLAWWAGKPAGSAVGHATGGGPILISPITGPVEQLSPDTFAVRFDRFGTNNIYGQWRSRDIWLMAVHPGDDTYVRAVQQSLLRIPLPLTNGAAQSITFPAIADQPVGTTAINLNATTSGTATYPGASVYYYVREGPAKVNGNSLEFTQIPPRAKFPVKVTVVATQYGRTIAPLLQTATPVERTFYVTATALQQWRQQKFGTYDNTGNAADSADPDNDGRVNLLEYATGSDPVSANSGPVAGVGSNVGGTRLTLTFNRIADPALTYTVEATSDLGGTWSAIWSSTGVSNVDGSVVVTDSVDVDVQTKRFLRLRVTR